MIKGMHPHALDSFASYAHQACFTRGERSRSGDSQTNAVLPSSEPSSCFDLCRRAQAPLPPAGGSRCKDNGWRRRDRGANNRRTSMYPIPGNIVGACETDVVRPIHIYVESAKRPLGPANAKLIISYVREAQICLILLGFLICRWLQTNNELTHIVQTCTHRIRY
jgi:hypothetical protein